jgi:signal transduction histidine kinase
LTTSIRNQFILLFGLTAILLVCITIAVHQLVLLPNFVHLEQQHIVKNLDRVANAIENELDHLDTLTNDWSAWDDTYRYAQDHNIEFEISNLTVSALINNRLNLLLIIDENGQKLWGISADEGFQTAIETKPFEQSEFSVEFPFFLSPYDKTPLSDQVKKGLMETSSGLMLFASRPILNSNERGPSRGTLIMGRLLGNIMLDKVAKLTGINFKLLNIERKGSQSDYKSYSSLSDVQEVVIRSDEQKVGAYKTYINNWGLPMMQLLVEEERRILREGENVLKLSTFYLLGGVVSALGVLMLTLQKTVAVPLNRITMQIKNSSNKSSQWRELTQEDYSSSEVNLLLDEFNALVKSLSNEKTNAENINFRLLKEAKKLKDAEKHLRSLDRLKSEFISTAAHELRTPIAIVMGYAEVLTDNEINNLFDQKQKEDFLNEIVVNSGRLSKIVDDILDLSLIEAGKRIPIDKQEVPIKKLLTKEVERLGLKSQHNLILEISSDLPEVIQIDTHRICQVLENLISNAMKYSEEGSDIIIQAERTESSCVITITDQGIGMSEEQLGKVFDKFYRVDSSDTAVGGLGIGMSIARQIIADHSGEIAIESQLGRGTKVSFTLPL